MSYPHSDLFRYCRQCNCTIRSVSSDVCPFCSESILSPFFIINSARFESSFGEFFCVHSESDFFINLERYGLQSIPVRDEGTFIHQTSLQSYLRAAAQFDGAINFVNDSTPDQHPIAECSQLAIEEGCNELAFRGRVITNSNPTDEDKHTIRKRFELPVESLEPSLNPRQFRIDMYFKDNLQDRVEEEAEHKF